MKQLFVALIAGMLATTAMAADKKAEPAKKETKADDKKKK